MAITNPPKKVGKPSQKPSGRKMVRRIKATADTAVTAQYNPVLRLASVITGQSYIFNFTVTNA
jgi:hypothetical protein